jgi:hypothetical protein
MTGFGRPAKPGGFFRAQMPWTRVSACGGAPSAKFRSNMIAPETFSHIENIKKRAGYLWRFL